MMGNEIIEKRYIASALHKSGEMNDGLGLGFFNSRFGLLRIRQGCLNLTDSLLAHPVNPPGFFMGLNEQGNISLSVQQGFDHMMSQKSGSAGE